MAKIQIPAFRMGSTAATPPFKGWFVLLLLPLLIVTLLPVGYMLREMLHPLIGRNGLILAAAFFGLAWLAYECFKPQLMQLWPRNRFEFDDVAQTIQRVCHNQYRILSRSTPIPIQDFEFIYANHHADREYSNHHSGDILLFSYRRGEIKLCTVLGDHADLMAVTQELSNLFGLPCKDYSTLIV